MILFSDIKIDENGISYVEKLPKGYRLATLDDFIVKHKCYDKRHRKKIGMQYLVQSAVEDIYYIRSVDERLLDIDIEPYIKKDQVFIDPKDVMAFTEKLLNEPKDNDVTEWYLK